jgi:hypothetical protein
MVDWKILIKDIKEALEPIEKKHNVSIKLGTLRYSDSSFNVKIEGLINSIDRSGERIEFDRLCNSFGLTREDYKRTFLYKGKTYELVGFNLKARKYPYVAREVGTENTTRFTESVITLIKGGNDKVLNILEKI